MEKIPFSKLEITSGKDSTQVATCVIPAETFKKYYQPALSRIKQNVTVAGFREGKAPDNVVEKQVGEFAVTQEMASMAVEDAIRDIITDKKLRIIGQPEVSITKISRDSDLEFTVTFPIMPDIDLGNYKEVVKKVLAERIETTPATEEEVQKLLDEVRHAHVHKKNPDMQGHDHELPEVTDAFAAEIGNFKTVAELMEHLKKSVEKEKEYQAKEKRRLQMLEALNAAIPVAVPQGLVKHQEDRMLGELSQNLSQFNLSLDAYLAQIKKSEADIRSEIRPTAEKRARLDLLMGAIAQKEGIKPDPAKIKQEVDAMLEHYEKADPKVVEDYATYFLTNEAVIAYLESLK